MMRYRFLSCYLWLSLIAICGVLTSCQKDVQSGAPGVYDLKISFKPTVDAAALVPGKTYQNAFGEDYSINTFKFYLHAVEFINTLDGSAYRLNSNDHFLIDLLDSSFSGLQLKIQVSAYNRIAFIVGVDSARNVSGAQTGDLDPAKGMFWTWNTGYIMAKLEGNSPLVATPNNVIQYHIGGFKASESALRKIVLDFPSSRTIQWKEGKKSDVLITANVNSWFKKTHDIRISDKAVSMTPGQLAIKIADNYSRMFTVVDILHE